MGWSTIGYLVGTLSMLDSHIVAGFLDTVCINTNDARLWKPFPLLFCFAVTNTALEDTNTVPEDP